MAINGTNSSFRTISTGVPQGSIIGPLLFLLYINDVGNLPLVGTPRLFADDTAIFYPRTCVNDIIDVIECDLRLLIDYFNSNLLSLNVPKTKYMIFHPPRKKIDVHRNPISGRPKLKKWKISNTWAFYLTQRCLGITISQMSRRKCRFYVEQCDGLKYLCLVWHY